jgi:hypothetical protein
MGKSIKTTTINMDNPTNHNKPPKAIIPTTAKIADTSPDPPTPIATDSSDLIDLHNETYHPISDLMDSQAFSDPPHENYHLIPTPTANTGSALSDNNLPHIYLKTPLTDYLIHQTTFISHPD